MSETKAIRLNKIARELNVGISTLVEFLQKKGHKVESSPNTKISQEQYELLVREYSSDLDEKKKSESFSLKNLRERKETISLDTKIGNFSNMSSEIDDLSDSLPDEVKNLQYGW